MHPLTMPALDTNAWQEILWNRRGSDAERRVKGSRAPLPHICFRTFQTSSEGHVRAQSTVTNG